MQQTGRKSRMQRIRSDFGAIVRNISIIVKLLRQEEDHGKNQKIGQLRWITKPRSGIRYVNMER